MNTIILSNYNSNGSLTAKPCILARINHLNLNTEINSTELNQCLLHSNMSLCICNDKFSSES